MGSWFLVRHGETDWNPYGRSQVDCTGLSSTRNRPDGRVLELWNDTNHLTSTVGGGTT